MTGPGLAALPEGGRVDFAAVRAARRERLFAAMAAYDLDAVLLGHPANVAFAGGARVLWTSGSRPWTPSCVVVGADRSIHLLATWDEGVPAEIPRDHLFGLSWNPVVAGRRLAGVPGLATAGRIGADGTSVRLRRLVAATAPGAELVDGRPALGEARATKDPAEVRAVETACALAEAALDTMASALDPGVTARHLLGLGAERLGRLGTPVLPDEAVAGATAGGYRAVAVDAPLEAGALVALSPSAHYAGYEGTVARTFAVGGACTDAQSALGARCRAALDVVVATCRPGITGGALLDAWDGAGGGALPVPLAHGLGLGMEPPVVGMGLGRDAVLRAGTVLAVQGWVHDPSVGGWLERDVVVVDPDGPRSLTRWPR